jgi:hypothetical protein
MRVDCLHLCVDASGAFWRGCEHFGGEMLSTDMVPIKEILDVATANTSSTGPDPIL